MESNFDIRRTAYFVEIRQKEPFNNRVKERINLRRASRDLFCSECHEQIKKGSNYIRDKFWYGTDRIIKRTNFICLRCWRGELPILVSGNFVKKTNSTEK